MSKERCQQHFTTERKVDELNGMLKYSYTIENTVYIPQ
jgi:hypothetical protein